LIEILRAIWIALSVPITLLRPDQCGIAALVRNEKSCAQSAARLLRKCGRS
jgi:hypothetical protein